jgi:hypothetical protein
VSYLVDHYLTCQLFDWQSCLPRSHRRPVEPGSIVMQENQIPSAKQKLESMIEK